MDKSLGQRYPSTSTSAFRLGCRVPPKAFGFVKWNADWHHVRSIYLCLHRVWPASCTPATSRKNTPRAASNDTAWVPETQRATGGSQAQSMHSLKAPRWLSCITAELYTYANKRLVLKITGCHIGVLQSIIASTAVAKFPAKCTIYRLHTMSEALTNWNGVSPTNTDRTGLRGRR